MDKEEIKKYGRGVWWIIHVESVKATNKRKQDNFIELLNTIQEEYPCVQCRIHMDQYFRENDINKYRNYENGLGFAIYGWKFHNAVNVRLNKPLMTWEEFNNMYILKLSNCFKDCADNVEENINVTFINNKSEKFNEKQNKFSLY